MLKPTAGPADKNRHGPLPRLSPGKSPRLVSLLVAALGSVLLSGCNLELLSPKGSVGEQEKWLILVALFIMLMVVIPVIVLTLWFAWRYRETNTRATYAPKWSHSTKIEVVVWGIPCVIVACLALLIWESTHKLDPYRPLASQVKPIEVDVVALNWKWLFIYPEFGVASLNQLAIPVGTPINFRLTSESMMNSFFIPQLGSMVYTMAGMQTRLHLIADTPGVYLGQSAAYSGPGFSDMHFKTLATSREEFDAWIRTARASSQALDLKTYRALEQPSSKDPVTLYGSVAPKLFDQIADKYMMANDQICRADTLESLQAFQRVPSAPLGRMEQ
ncbi:cytochrome bo3 quinol oxidase subunit 2 [Cupriavidus sp. YR651]|uniref:ubiquinol oxidase subunit II n=1 Tax=Cupriavidus sp. YR651 TaxID=1855315 RepID=UPI00088D1CEE|nr:ubiquinol oxidase subunit II [Cupriavidus sp. YR651]SDD05661.1 cytochrome bo3 quinol oxidase subunit 2 [Cupriavidus sp. YR651]